MVESGRPRLPHGSEQAQEIHGRDYLDWPVPGDQEHFQPQEIRGVHREDVFGLRFQGRGDDRIVLGIGGDQVEVTVRCSATRTLAMSARLKQGSDEDVGVEDSAGPGSTVSADIRDVLLRCWMARIADRGTFLPSASITRASNLAYQPSVPMRGRRSPRPQSPPTAQRGMESRSRPSAAWSVKR